MNVSPKRIFGREAAGRHMSESKLAIGQIAFLPGYSELAPLRALVRYRELQASWLKGMQWNLAARAVSKTSKFNPPLGLPCSVTPQGPCPPFEFHLLYILILTTLGVTVCLFVHSATFCAVPQCTPDPTPEFSTALAATGRSAKAGPVATKVYSGRGSPCPH